MLRALPLVVLALGPLECIEGIPEDPKVAAGLLWSKECARCHGAKGMGDGPDGGALPTKPPNLADPCNPLNESRVHEALTMRPGDSMPDYHRIKRYPEALDELTQLVLGLSGDKVCKTPGQ